MKTQTRYNRIIKDAVDDAVIHVKAQDIKGAVCRDHGRCVVAKAIMRQKKSTIKWVDVGNCVVLLGTGDRAGRRYMLDAQSKKQIRFFDENDGRFAPCKVRLKAPTVGKRMLGERTGESHTGGNKRGKNKMAPTR